MTSTLPKVVARSLPEANDDLLDISPRTAVVSIGSPGSDPPYGFRPHNPLHVRLEFHDIWEADAVDPQGRPPSLDDVRKLLAAALVLRTAELVYIHCNAGISRSTAAAYILWCHWLGPGEEAEAMRRVLEDRPTAVPNPLLVRYADAQMNRGGEMLRHLRLEA